MHKHDAARITAFVKTFARQKQPSFEGQNFRLYLQHELVRRCEKNESYSLRSFAKALDVSHATLSSILAGKRPLTAKSVIKLCQALKLSPTKTKSFIEGIEGKEHSKETTATSALIEHRELTLDAFVSISEWYHDAITELTHTKNFKGDTKWIAKVLGISTSEVKIAVERLQRLELLEITPEGKWIDLSRNNTTNISNDFTTSALRKLQKKVLELSMKALEELPRTKRDHTSTVFAMQTSDLPEIKERIKKFRFELAAYIERDGVVADSVHQLAVSFFPLTKSENPENQGE